MAYWIEIRTCNPIVAGSSLRSGRNCWWGEWITSALSPPSIPRLRCPWARHRTPNCSLYLQYHDWGALEQDTEPPTALSTFNTTTEVPLSKTPNPQLLSPPSIPRLRCPWARHRTPNCSLHLQYHDWGALEQGTEPPTALSTFNTTTEVSLSKTPNPPTALSTFNTTTEVPLSKAPNPQLLSPPSIPRLRCPSARHRTPNCSPGAAAMAAHCSGCVFTTVCVHLGGLNAEHKFPSMGHHTWPHVFRFLFLLFFVSENTSCLIPE